MCTLGRDGSTQGNPPIVGGKQKRQADECSIEQLGFDKILKRLHVETLAKLLPLAELLAAGAATLKAVFAGELVGFGTVLEQVNEVVGAPMGTPFGHRLCCGGCCGESRQLLKDARAQLEA